MGGEAAGRPDSAAPPEMLGPDRDAVEVGRLETSSMVQFHDGDIYLPVSRAIFYYVLRHTTKRFPRKSYLPLETPSVESEDGVLRRPTVTVGPGLTYFTDSSILRSFGAYRIQVAVKVDDYS